MPHRKNGTTRRAPMGTDANLEPRTVRGRTDSPRTPVAIRARGIEGAAITLKRAVELSSAFLSQRSCAAPNSALPGSPWAPSASR